MKSDHREGRLLAGVFVASAVAMIVPITAAAKPPIPQQACDNRDNNSYSKLLECVRLEGVREHQVALQAIAPANGGTRADTTPGYLASVDYVDDTMTAAGWDVERTSSRTRHRHRGRTDRAHPAECTPRSPRSTRARAMSPPESPPSTSCSQAPQPGHERLRRSQPRRRRVRQLGGQHRARPARHVRLRGKGTERGGGRCHRGDHLQPGQHDRA